MSWIATVVEFLIGLFVIPSVVLFSVSFIVLFFGLSQNVAMIAGSVVSLIIGIVLFFFRKALAIGLVIGSVGTVIAVIFGLVAL